MSLGLAILVVAGFALIVSWSGLVGHAKEAGSRAQASLRALTDPSLEDDEKELRLRADALVLFRLLGQILLGSALTVLVPLGGVWFLGLAGIGSPSGVLEVLGRLDFLLVASLAGGLVYWCLGRVRGR